MLDIGIRLRALMRYIISFSDMDYKFTNLLKRNQHQCALYDKRTLCREA